MSHEENNIIDAEISKWLRQGIIQPSVSPWASPVVLVKKKPIDPDDPTEAPKYRLCVDYRKLNKLTKTDSFPMPLVQDALDILGRSSYFSIIDLRSAFLQLPLHADDREKTAFVTRRGLFEFNVLPFGLKNSPSNFQRLMHTVLQDLQGQTCMVFLDDIIVFSATWEEHLQRLREVLDRLRRFNLRAHPDKCVLATDELLYLGHKISASGNLPDPARVKAISTLQPPRTLTEVRAFLGLVSYYRKFVAGFASIATPLHRLLKKDLEFNWDGACQAAFEDLKQRLMQSPILKRPDFSLPFILQTDWSKEAIAAVLCQVQDGREHPIAYASRALTPTESNYAATEGECLAVVWAIKYFRAYLWGRKFKLETDHQALKWLMTTTDLSGKLARWSLRLQEFDFEIEYKPGATNQNADALTRLPIASNSMQPEVPQSDGAGDGPIIYMNVLYASNDADDEDDTPEIVEPPPKRSRRNVSSKLGEGTNEPQHTQVASAVDLSIANFQTLQQRIAELESQTPLPLPPALVVSTPSAGPPALVTPSQLDLAPIRVTASQQNDQVVPTYPEEEEESISISLPCEICSQDTDDTKMLVCDSCNQGFHMFCLRPRLFEVPTGSWFCGDCGGTTQRTAHSLDITEDEDVLTYLRSKELPDTASAAQRRRITKRAQNYFISTYDGRLVRLGNRRYPARTVCSRDERHAVIKACHELGHMGILRTSKLVNERYYWGGIVQDVKDFIANCPSCKLQNAKFNQPQQLQNIPINDQSFYRVGIDLVGPLQPSKKGNCYIIVAMDYLTKWPEVAAVTNKQSKTVADFFMHNVISRHGCPREVLSDNGGEFFGEFDQLLQSCCIDHRLTSPNHPNANGLVEHFNCTLVTALRKCVGQHPEDWDDWIPAVLLGYRCSVQASTKFSPFYMLYARQPMLPVEGAISKVDAQAESAPIEHDIEKTADMVVQKADELSKLIPTALKNIGAAQEKQKRDYTAKRKYSQPAKEPDLHEGDFVVIKQGRRSSKLLPKAGPEILKILKFLNSAKTVAILVDASDPPKKWSEHTCNLALWAPNN